MPLVGELETMAAERGVSLSSLAPTPFDDATTGRPAAETTLVTNAGGASGGFMEYLFRRAAAELYVGQPPIKREKKKKKKKERKKGKVEGRKR